MNILITVEPPLSFPHDPPQCNSQTIYVRVVGLGGEDSESSLAPLTSPGPQAHKYHQVSTGSLPESI